MKLTLTLTLLTVAVYDLNFDYINITMSYNNVSRNNSIKLKNRRRVICNKSILGHSTVGTVKIKRKKLHKNSALYFATRKLRSDRSSHAFEEYLVENLVLAKELGWSFTGKDILDAVQAHCVEENIEPFGGSTRPSKKWLKLFLQRLVAKKTCY